MAPSRGTGRAAVAVLATALLLPGCAAGGPARTTAREPVREPAATAARQTARPPGLQPLATALGCTPTVSVDADELRQGECRTARGAYRLVTFATGNGLRAWLTEARAYGGTYLVGDRWVVTARPEAALTPLKARVGGRLDAAPAHDHPSDPSPDHADHMGGMNHPAHVVGVVGGRVRG
ncbi:hypothetical protein, partial [Streptomyces sp. NRRL S-87]|uniref:hypothetical protein n=1 Tax=Streptomyces sp. NRRL S-87 TaxID=1463920 RepID=UPI00068AFA32